MKYFVYILYSKTRDQYYIGSCADVEERLRRHNAGATTSTKSGRPWEIVYQEAFADKTQAIRRENHLKKMKSRDFIKDLISQSRD
ncbi:MAG: GIY-YIG nuclease family protein [Bacteroidota bacterium]